MQIMHKSCSSLVQDCSADEIAVNDGANYYVNLGRKKHARYCERRGQFSLSAIYIARVLY